MAPAAQHVVAVADVALVPVVGRELEHQQLLLLHGAARVVPEAVEELDTVSQFSLKQRL